MPVESKSTFSIGKGLVWTLIAIPLCLEVGFLSIFALFMGILSLPMGIVFLLLGGLGCLYVYSLIVSLWLGRRDGWIVFGLRAGIVFLAIGAYNWFDDAAGRSSPVSNWTTKNYSDALLGILAIAGIALSLFLLYEHKPPKPPTWRIGGPIPFRHASVTKGDSSSPTARPMGPPILPYRPPKHPSEKPPQAEQD